MAQNKVEYHIQAGGLFTFKVNAGATVKIGELVELVGDRTVATTTGLSTKAVGVVYSGTVGVDGIGTGYSGNNGDVVTVVILKPFVFLTAGEVIVAGDRIATGATGRAMKTGATADNKIGMAITGAGSAGAQFIAVLG